MEQLKTCSQCRNVLPVDSFYRRKGGGYWSACKTCTKHSQSAYVDRHKEKIRKAQAEYRQKNADKIRKFNAAYYANNKAVISIKASGYYKRRKEYFLANRRDYYRDNKQSVLNRVLAWGKRNPDKTRVYRERHANAHPEELKASRRASLRKSFVELTNVGVKRIIQNSARRSGLQLPFSMIPDSLVEAERARIKTQRLIKEKTK